MATDGEWKMISILKGCGLLMVGVIPQGLQDFICVTASLFCQVIKFALSIVMALVILAIAAGLLIGFVYLIFASPLIAIAICAVIVMLKVVFK